jgi:quinol monooxygenase YgiN
MIAPKKGGSVVTVGNLIRVEAKPGKEDDVEAMLKAAVAVVSQEQATVAWFALRLGPSTFAVFDAFADNAGRQAHLDANTEALRAAAPALFAETPSIDPVDVIAAKLPGQ